MKLKKVASDSFLLLRAVWPIRLARQFLAGGSYTHTILLRENPDLFYLFTRQQTMQVLEGLEGLDEETTLEEAFDLREDNATVALEAEVDIPDRLDRVIALDSGCVSGFFDASAQAIETIRNRRSDAVERFEAYPALSAPPAVGAGKEFEFYVGFRSDPDRTVEGGGLVVIERPEPGAVCDLVVVCDGADIDRQRDCLPLRADIVVRFRGKAHAGRTEIVVKAEFYYEGQVIGVVKRTLQVGAPPAGSKLPFPPSRRSIPIPGLESQVDLTVSITFCRDGRLCWTFNAPFPALPLTDPVVTELAEARDFAARLTRDLRDNDQAGAFAENTLRSKGQEIFRLMPPEFLEVLQRVRDAIGRPPTLLLLTNEPYVPWELALLDPSLDPSVPAFLACQTPMSRWLDDEYVTLPPSIRAGFRRLFAIAARYGIGTDQRELKEALAEQKGLQDRWGAVPLKAERAELQTLIVGRPQGDAVHFAVHGFSDPTLNDESLLLADNTRVRAEALVGAHQDGDTPRFAFIFLNACQVGTAGTSLGQAAGFPGVMVRGGSCGFIAPLWEVDDTEARVFAEAFYQAVLGDNVPVAEALRAQRQTYKSAGSTTPLAYVYYGHPALRLAYSEHSERPKCQPTSH